MQGYVGRHRRPEPHGYPQSLPPRGWGYRGGYPSGDRTPDRLPRVQPGPAPGARPPAGDAGVSRADWDAFAPARERLARSLDRALDPKVFEGRI